MLLGVATSMLGAAHLKRRLTQWDAHIRAALHDHAQQYVLAG